MFLEEMRVKFFKPCTWQCLGGGRGGKGRRHTDTKQQRKATKLQTKGDLMRDLKSGLWMVWMKEGEEMFQIWSIACWTCWKPWCWQPHALIQSWRPILLLQHFSSSSLWEMHAAHAFNQNLPPASCGAEHWFRELSSGPAAFASVGGWLKCLC